MFNWIHAPSRSPVGALITVVLAVACLAPSDDVTPPPATSQPATRAAAASRARVALTAEPITLDGRLDEAVWQRAEAYTLVRPADRPRGRGKLAVYEASAVRFARDERYLYVAFDFADENMVQTKDEDYQHHYLTGDVGELFLKPADAPHYWEFYATPHGRRTVFFFPIRKQMTNLTENYDRNSHLQVAVQWNGSLNDKSDTDHGWISELAVPLDELAAAGVPFDDGHRWLVLVGRYNHGRRGVPMEELSSFPALRHSDFHAYERWIPLELEQRSEPATTAPASAP